MAIKVGDALLMVGADTKDMDQGMARMNKNIKQGTDKWKSQLKAAGAAFTAAGVAGLALVASSKKMNASLGQTALTMGATTGELRSLALATTNVTFPLESVTKTFDFLVKAGIRNQEVLAASATAFDTLGDATGSSAETVAGQLIPAFKLFGEEIPKSAAELDNFTWLTKNTTVELSEFGGVMSYVAQYGSELNLELDDMIAIMAVLESKGQSGSTATKMFRTAVTQAASGASTLNEALGITQEEVDGFRTEMEGAVGITQDYADVANTQYGLMDNLKQKWSEITLQLGSFLEPLEPIMGAMAAIGPMMMVMSTGMGQAAIKTMAHTIALIAHKIALMASKVAMVAVTAAQWLWNAAITANPIGLIIIAIAAFVAAIIGIVKHFDKVKDALTKTWDYLKILFATSIRTILEKAIKPFLGALAKVIDVGSSIVGFFNKEWGESMKRAANSVRGAVDEAIEWTYSVEENARAHLNQKGAIEETTRATDKETRAAEAYDQAMRDAILTIDLGAGKTEELTDAVNDEANALDELASKADKAAKGIRDWHDAQADAVKTAKDLWQEVLIENSELGKLGITLNDVIKHGYSMGISQEDMALALHMTAGAADQATALLAALGIELGSISDTSLNPLVNELNAVGAAAIAAAGSIASVGQVVDQYAETHPEEISPDFGTMSQQGITDIIHQANVAGATPEQMQAIMAAWGDATWTGGLPDLSDIPGLSELEGFQHGGIVPGAVGQPVMALVHGGETIVPAGGGITNTFNISQLTVREEADIRRIAEELYRLQQLRSVIHG